MCCSVESSRPARSWLPSVPLPSPRLPSPATRLPSRSRPSRSICKLTRPCTVPLAGAGAAGGPSTGGGGPLPGPLMALWQGRRGGVSGAAAAGAAAAGGADGPWAARRLYTTHRWGSHNRCGGLGRGQARGQSPRRAAAGLASRTLYTPAADVLCHSRRMKTSQRRSVSLSHPRGRAWSRPRPLASRRVLKREIYSLE